MSNDLRNIYSSAKRLDRYFDEFTPCDLYRGHKRGSKLGLMVPTLFGFYKRNEPRYPDVYFQDGEGSTPQLSSDDTLVTESKSQPLTRQILMDADKYMVRGCRTMTGNYRGLSVFNEFNTRLPFDWFLITENTEIPKGLAVTRDASYKQVGMTHYTVAPKDDMPLSLYLVQLEALGKNATAIKA